MVSIRKSIHASEILENEKRIQAQNTTRCNRHILMIRSAVNIPGNKPKECDLSIKLTAHYFNRKVQGVPLSQSAANPRHQEEAKKDKN